MKVADAIGAQLDWMVAKADDNLHPKGDVRLLDGKVFTIEAGDYEQSDRWQRYSPSTVWAQGGPLIDSMVREGLRLTGYKSLPTQPVAKHRLETSSQGANTSHCRHALLRRLQAGRHRRHSTGAAASRTVKL